VVVAGLIGIARFGEVVHGAGEAPSGFTGEVKVTCPLLSVTPESVPDTQPDQVMSTVTPSSTAQSWSWTVMVASA